MHLFETAKYPGSPYFPPKLTPFLSQLSGAPFGTALFRVPIGTLVVGADLDAPANARDKL